MRTPIMVGYSKPSAFLKVRQNRVNAVKRAVEAEEANDPPRYLLDRLGFGGAIGIVHDGEDPALPDPPAGSKLQ